MNNETILADIGELDELTLNDLKFYVDTVRCSHWRHVNIDKQRRVAASVRAAATVLAVSENGLWDALTYTAKPAVSGLDADQWQKIGELAEAESRQILSGDPNNWAQSDRLNRIAMVAYGNRTQLQSTVCPFAR